MGTVNLGQNLSRATDRLKLADQPIGLGDRAAVSPPIACCVCARFFTPHHHECQIEGYVSGLSARQSDSETPEGRRPATHGTATLEGYDPQRAGEHPSNPRCLSSAVRTARPRPDPAMRTCALGTRCPRAHQCQRAAEQNLRRAVRNEPGSAAPTYHGAPSASARPQPPPRLQRMRR